MMGLTLTSRNYFNPDRTYAQCTDPARLESKRICDEFYHRLLKVKSKEELETKEIKVFWIECAGMMERSNDDIIRFNGKVMIDMYNEVAAKF